MFLVSSTLHFILVDGQLLLKDHYAAPQMAAFNFTVAFLSIFGTTASHAERSRSLSLIFCRPIFENLRTCWMMGNISFC